METTTTTTNTKKQRKRTQLASNIDGLLFYFEHGDVMMSDTDSNHDSDSD